MLITVITAILNLYIAFRIVSFTRSSSSKNNNCYFYTAVAVLIVAVSLENAISIIFVGQKIYTAEFLFTVFVAVVVFFSHGNIGKLFDFLRQQNKETVRNK